MRVLFLTNIPSPYRVDFFNALGKLCDLTVLFEAKSAKDRNAEWKPDRFQNFKAVFMKGIRIGEAEAFCPEVLLYLSEKQFDRIIVGFYASPTGILAIEAMKWKRIPFLISSDGGIAKGERGYKFKLKKHLLCAASGWLSTGKTTNEYLEYYGARPECTYTYPFTSVKEKEALKYPLAKKEKDAYKKVLGIKEEKVVLSVGQFIPRKGYDILLNACKKLDRDVGVYIIGGCPTEEYKELQERLGLVNIHFVGFRKKEELIAYYKAASLFVLPTREDIWGLVINEAMSYGLPIVTTDACVAGLELVECGINGYIVPTENPDRLAEAMNTILQEEALAKRMASANTEKMKKYTIEEMAKRHIDILENLRY